MFLFCMCRGDLGESDFCAFFSKVTGVNHKIKFPAPRAHTVALHLASLCPGSGLGAFSPVRSVGLHTTIALLLILMFSSSSLP